MIATILSAQCTDEVVNRTTKILFNEYSEPEHFVKANINKIKKIIRPTGYYSLKANRRKVCQARKPDCDKCLLNDICPYFDSKKKLKS